MTLNKRLVLLTKYFPPEMGAPQSRLYETVKGLQKRGWKVLVVTALPNYPKGRVFDGYRGKLYMTDNVDGIDMLRYTLYSSHSKKPIPRIISMVSFGGTSAFALRRVKQFKPDYVITESPPLTLGLTGLLLAKHSGAKHIMNVSDIWPLSALRLGAISEGYLYRKLEALEQYLYKRSWGCMGQSAEIVERLKEAGSHRSLLFRNGVDFDRFEQHRKTDGKRAGKLRIVYAGLLGVAQDILSLCKHVDFASAGVEWHIYGEGSQKEDIVEYLSANPGKEIYLHPSVHRDEVPALLMQHDVSLIPLMTTIYGAVPSKIYEAMAAGLPVIFSGGGEGEKIIAEQQTGWCCEPGNYTQINQCVQQVANTSKEELSRLRDNCIHAAKNIFNREIQIEQLNKFLEQE